MLRRLSELCAERRPVTLTAGQPPRILAGRFAGLAPDGSWVEIEFLGVPAGLELGPAEPCTVVFRDGPRSRVFAGSTLPWDSGGGPFRRIRVSLPMTSGPVELRSSWRIPLNADSGLQVKVSSQGRTFHPRPIDISPGGLLVEFETLDEVLVKEEEAVEVELQLADLRAVLEALPQRRSNRSFALYFCQVLRELRHGRLAVPNPLKVILERLETRWARSAAGPTKSEEHTGSL